MSRRPRFHYAFPVYDLAAARRFYGEVLGCPEGRSSAQWVDFDLYGHQIVAHLVTRSSPADLASDGGKSVTNPVDGQNVPVPHFGVLLEPGDWRALADRLTDRGVVFEIAPYTRFAGQVGEQSTMFFYDPSGNALEFKSFADDTQVFAR